MNTDATAIHTLAVETDTRQAAAYEARHRADQYLRFTLDEIHRLANDTRQGGRFSSGPWNMSDQAAVDAVAAMVAEKPWLRSDLEKVNEYQTQINEAQATIVECENIWSDNGCWSRFFIVRNNNGHIHSSMECQTCFDTTDFGWLPTLSGLTEAEAVADQGEILCSVCFPSAPSEWTTGESNEKKAARAEREAAKAERDAKKAAKAITAVDGSPLRVASRGTLATLVSAKSWLTDAASWNVHYPRTNHDGTVDTHHPSFTPEDVAKVAEAVAAKLGTDAATEIEAAAKRAAKRK